MIGNGSEGMGEEREIDIFVTNKCNSNCIMCPMSESSRRKNNPEHIEELKAYIRELPKDVEYINVTGGEPTLLIGGEEPFCFYVKRKISTFGISTFNKWKISSG